MDSNCHAMDYFFLNFPFFRTFLSVVLASSAVAAIGVNFLILRVICKTPSLRKPSNILLASLALTDFLVGAIVQPLMVTFNIAAIKKWSKIYCISSRFSEHTGMWLCSISLGTLTLISIDRLLAVRLKNRYKTFVTSKRVSTAMAVCWFVASVLNTFNMITPTTSIFSVVLIGVGTFCLLFVIILCYSMAFRTLFKISNSVKTQQTQPTVPTTNSHCDFNVLKYRKSLKTMLIILFTTALFYMPYFGVTVGKLVIYNTGLAKKFSIATLFAFNAVGELMLYLNSTVNPLVYLWRFRDLREASKNLVRGALKIPLCP